MRISLSPMTIEKKKKSVAIIISILGFIGTYLFYSLYIKNCVPLIMNLRQELGLKKQLLQIKEKNYEDMAENADFLKSYSSDSDEAPRILTDVLVTEALIRSRRLMEDGGLTDVEMQIGEKESLEAAGLDSAITSLYRIPFILTGIGSYENAVSYMQELSDDKFFYTFENIRLSSKNVINKGDTVLELHLSLYGFTEQETEGNPGEPRFREVNPFYYE